MDRPAVTVPASRRRGSAPLVALLAAAVAVAALGAWNLSSILSGSGHDRSQVAAAAPKKGFGVAQDIPSSFGVVAVERVQKVEGLTARSLSGVTHGINSLVPAGKTQIQIYATLTNLSESPVRYDPRQFVLATGGPNGKAILAQSASIRRGVLQPNASIDAQIAYVIPQRRQRMWARFTDPGAKKPIVVDLGRVAKAPSAAAVRNFHSH